MCANFQSKQTTVTLLTQTCPKMDLELEIHKTNVVIRIGILKKLCGPIFWKNNLDFFGPNLPKNGFWGRNFKNLKVQIWNQHIHDAR